MDCKHEVIYQSKGSAYCRNCGVELLKVTIYYTSEMFGSVCSIEAYLIEHGRWQYAQYSDAPYIIYRQKGKRNKSRLIKAYKPYLIIVDGWNAPKPDGMYEKSETQNGVTIKTSKYSCFDDNYKIDFDNILLQHPELKIVADYRDKSYIN
jgi:hypothetical protein